jgi:hypothetical protein
MLDIDERQILAESPDAIRIVEALLDNVISRHKSKLFTLSTDDGNGMPLLVAKTKIDGMLILQRELQLAIKKELKI